MSATLESRSTLQPIDTGSKLAHGAFWIMARRVTLVAAGVDLAFLVLFFLLDSPILAWLNLVSISIYAGAYWLLSKRINKPALLLIWIEVLGHAAIGSMLVGWDSGFHYYLLMFIPAIVVSARIRTVVLLVLLLLVFYLALHAGARLAGVQAPLSTGGLMVVHSFNVAIVFAMAAYTARFYYGTVRRAEKKLVELATQDPLTGLSNRRSLIALARNEMARARRSGEPVALIIADIDHFKQINDQRGHDVGDRVITDAGASLLRLCRTHPSNGCRERSAARGRAGWLYVVSWGRRAGPGRIPDRCDRACGSRHVREQGAGTGSRDGGGLTAPECPANKFSSRAPISPRSAGRRKSSSVIRRCEKDCRWPNLESTIASYFEPEFTAPENPHRFVGCDTRKISHNANMVVTAIWCRPRWRYLKPR